MGSFWFNLMIMVSPFTVTGTLPVLQFFLSLSTPKLHPAQPLSVSSFSCSICSMSPLPTPYHGLLIYRATSLNFTYKIYYIFCVCSVIFVIYFYSPWATLGLFKSSASYCAFGSLCYNPVRLVWLRCLLRCFFGHWQPSS